MKSLLSVLFSKFLIIGCLLAAPTVAYSATKVSISVKPIQREESDEINTKGKPRKEKHMQKLEITLQNVSRTALENVKVKYTIFGRNLDGNEVVVLLGGEETVTVPPMSSAKVDTKEATASKTTAGTVKKKRVQASGQRLAGYGVQAFQGEELIGEFFQPVQNKSFLPK